MDRKKIHFASNYSGKSSNEKQKMNPNEIENFNQLFSFMKMATFQAKPFGQSDFKRTLGFLIEIRPSLRLGNTHTVLHKIVRYSPNSTFLF